jgi:long-subunit fatty acid transport protein
VKELIYILFLCLMLPLAGLAQNESNNNAQSNFKNQIDLDIHIVGGELSYKYKVTDNFSIGGGAFFGLSPIFVVEQRKTSSFFDPNSNQIFGEDKTFYKSDAVLEILAAKFIIDYKMSEKIHFHLAFKSSILKDETSNTNLNGIELGMFYSYKKVEFGVKPIIGNNEGQFMIGIPLFIIRVRLSIW